MGTAFEVALICDLKPNLLPQTADTMVYLPRSQDYDFDLAIEHPWFEVEFSEEWRSIIANNHLRCGEEFSTQTRRSLLTDQRLCFRVLLDDDTFYNVGWFFLEWLSSASNTEGLVGYYVDVTQFVYRLIYFNDEKVTELRSAGTEIPAALIQSIDTLLGGSGCITYFE